MGTEFQFTKPVSGAFTGSVEGDRIGSVSFFGSASFAPQAGDAFTATSASHAVNADTASLADTAATASFVSSSNIVGTVESASFADNALAANTATSASHAVQADNAATADLATTASHALDFDGDISASQVLPGTFQTGDFVFDGDVTIDGTASIKHLSVVTTSQIFESGSSIFGDTLDDTHQFTGSVLVTGSVEADTFVGSGSGIVGIVSASHAINADTASFAENAGTASLTVSASFAETASFALSTQDAGTASLAVTASFAEKAAVAPMNLNLNSFFGAEMKLLVPVAIIEQDDGQRTVASLLGYTQTRLIVRVTQAPTGSTTEPAGVIAVEGSLDDSTFVFLAGGTAGAGTGAPSASLSGTIDQALTVIGPWQDITGTLAVEDVFLRWVTYSGSNVGGAFRPRVGSINLQVR